VTSPLENLSGPGRPLQKEPPDAKEFAGLTRSAIARLTEDPGVSVSPSVLKRLFLHLSKTWGVIESIGPDFAPCALWKKEE
jgi:hypothetical protein